MSNYTESFYEKLEGIIEEIDDLLSDYQVLEAYDCEREISDAREILSDMLYKISRME